MIFNSTSTAIVVELLVNAADTPNIPRVPAIAVTGTVGGTISSSSNMASNRLLLMLA